MAINCGGSVTDVGRSASCGVRTTMEFIFVALQLSSVLALFFPWSCGGIFPALKLAWERGFRRICAYSNSRCVVRVLRKCCYFSHPCYGLVKVSIIFTIDWSYSLGAFCRCKSGCRSNSKLWDVVIHSKLSL